MWERACSRSFQGLAAKRVLEEPRRDVPLVMRLGQQEKFPIDGVAQFRQVPVAKLRQQHHPIGLQVVDDPRAPAINW